MSGVFGKHVDGVSGERPREAGFALILALFIVAAVLIMGMAVMTVSMMNMESAGQISIAQQNFQIADAGVEFGLNWLIAQTLPPENNSAVNTLPPFSDYTTFSNLFNPICPDTGVAFPYPEVRYRVAFERAAPVDTGQSLTIGTEYSPIQPFWHYYLIEAQARDGRTAALGTGTDQFDRAIRMVARRLYFH